MPYNPFVSRLIAKLHSHRYTMAGAMAGALLGWLYWSRVGCTSTHCPLVSNPWITTLYGSLLFATLSSEISKMFNAKKQNP